MDHNLGFKEVIFVVNMLPSKPSEDQQQVDNFGDGAKFRIAGSSKGFHKKVASKHMKMMMTEMPMDIS